jgi:hypothetical protein
MHPAGTILSQRCQLQKNEYASSKKPEKRLSLVIISPCNKWQNALME